MQANARTTTLRPDPAQLAAWWRAVVRPGDAHEVRIPKTRRNGPSRFFGVVGGYFDDGDAFVAALSGITGLDAEGVYLTLNPVNPALLARASNRLVSGAALASADADVVARRHLLVDVDPRRPSGISATDEERAAALERRDAIASALADLDWPPPVATLATGNGGGLLYRLRLANDAASLALVERTLKGLAATFGDGRVSIDTTVANAARIAKVAGTVAAKGDDVPGRPWRLATAEIGGRTTPVPVGLLELVAATAPEPAPRGGGFVPGGDVADRLRAAGVGFAESEKGYGRVYKLDRCLTSTDHDDGACVIAFASGALAYRCHHNRCADKRWEHVREQLGYGERAAGPAIVVGGQRPEREATPVPHLVVPAAGEGTNRRREEAIALTYDEPPDTVFLDPFGEYVDLLDPTTEAPRAFLLASFLTVIGAVMGRRLLADYARPVYPNLYTVLVGVTGRSRKDHAADMAIDTVNLQACPPNAMIPPPFSVLTDVSSSEGLIKWLKDHPNTVLRIEELTHLLDNAQRKSTSTILDILIRLWGTPLFADNQNKLSPVRADLPFFSVLAATQPARLETKMSDRELSSGYANRWVYVFGRGKEPKPDPPRYAPTELWDVYAHIHAAVTRHPAGTLFALTPAARDLWNDWYLATMRSMDDDEAEGAIRIRHHPLARKLALIYAAAAGKDAIDEPHLRAAIDLLDWSWKHLRRAIVGWGAGDEVKLENRIVDVLRAKGPLKKWRLQGQCKRATWPQSLFKRVIESMLANGAVVRDADDVIWLREQVEAAT